MTATKKFEPKQVSHTVSLGWVRSALSCHYHFYQRYVMKRGYGKKLPETIRLDRAFQYTAIECLETSREGHGLEPEDVAEIFRERFTTYLRDPYAQKHFSKLDQKYESWDEDVLERGVKMAMAWWERWGRHIEPIHINAPFDLTFGDVVEYGGDWILHGTIPAVVQDPKTGVVTLICPMITDKAWTLKRLLNDPTALYLSLGAREGGIHQALYVNLQVLYWKDDAVHFQNLNPRISDHDINGMLKKIHQARRQMVDACHSEAWLPNRWSPLCSEKTCRFVEDCLAEFGGEVK